MNRRYTLKLYPNAEQEQALLAQCRMVGQLWNAMLELAESRYRHISGQRGVVHRGEGRFVSGRWRPCDKAHLSEFDLGHEITEMLAACPEWRALSTWTPRRVAKSLAAAFDAFFRRAKSGAGSQSGYPKYRGRYKQNWLPHRFASGCRLARREDNPRSWSLYLKGVPGLIHCRGDFPLWIDEVNAKNGTDADIRFRDGTWWLSVGVEIDRPRSGGRDDLEVALGLIDGFARVNGRLVLASEIGHGLPQDRGEVEHLQQLMAKCRRGSEEYARLRMRKSRLEARRARQRKEALHEWTTAIIARASSVTVIKPASVKKATASAKGDEREWGAAVKTKAALNRHVLDQCVFMTAQMLKYKAEEAGIPYYECAHDDLVVGGELVKATKEVRRTRKVVQREKEALHV